jgi:pentatricopeptide repeat protein
MYKPNFNAFEYLADMTEQLITADVNTFNILIHSSIEQGNFAQATDILETM